MSLRNLFEFKSSDPESLILLIILTFIRPRCSKKTLKKYVVFNIKRRNFFIFSIFTDFRRFNYANTSIWTLNNL